MRTTQESYELFSTSAGSNTPTKQQLYGHLPPTSKTMHVTAREKWTDSKVTFYYGSLLMDVPVLADQ